MPPALAAQVRATLHTGCPEATEATRSVTSITITFFSRKECMSRAPPASVAHVAYPAAGARCIGQVAIFRGTDHACSNTELDVSETAFEVCDGSAAESYRVPFFRPDAEFGNRLFQGVFEGLVP